MGTKCIWVQFLVLFFLAALYPVHLIAGKVEPGDVIAITSALVGDQVYVPKVAYNSKRNEYLVVYHWKNDTLFPGINRQVHGARISAKGQYLENFVISDLANHCAAPGVDYDPVNDRYLVSWMYDVNGDESNWDLQARFVSWDGPDAGTPSFVVSAQPLNDEYNPQVAYGAAQKDFMVVTNLFRNDGAAIKPYIAGLRVKADGSGFPGGGGPDFTISSVTENLVNPHVAYNSVRDQYLVVYDNAVDIFGQRVNGLTGGSFGPQIGIAGWPDPEDRPAVAFSQSTDTYVVTWDSKRLSGSGEVYGRYVQGDGTVTTVFRLDDDIGGVRPDFTTAIACKQSTDECLAYWITIHNNTYYTFGRQLHAGSTVEGGSPYVNLNTVASWGTDDPQLAVGGGAKNYFMAFKGISNGIPTMFGQPTRILFPWHLFQPAFIQGKGGM